MDREVWRTMVHQKALSLLLLQVGGIITLAEEKGGPFLAPWKTSVFVSP